MQNFLKLLRLLLVLLVLRRRRRYCLLLFVRRSFRRERLQQPFFVCCFVNDNLRDNGELNAIDPSRSTALLVLRDDPVDGESFRDAVPEFLIAEGLLKALQIDPRQPCRGIMCADLLHGVRVLQIDVSEVNHGPGRVLRKFLRDFLLL